MVGKYVDLSDSYKSLNEALRHAGMKNHARVKIDYVDSETITPEDVAAARASTTPSWCPAASASAASKARSPRPASPARHKVPYLGICLGMQVATIEYARNVAGLKNANSTEFDPETPAPGDRADHRVEGRRRHDQDAQREVRPRRHHAPGRAELRRRRPARWPTASTATS